MEIPLPQIDPVAYRLAWKPGDYCFYTPEQFEKEIYKSSAEYWALYANPQLDLLESPAVYMGSHFIQPKYLKDGIVPEGFIPLYLGHVLNQPRVGYEVATLFPDILEEQLKREQPLLFVDKVLGK